MSPKGSENFLIAMNPTPYKVSTITATGSINSLIDLDIFYNEASLVKNEDDTEGVIYIEYGKNKSDTIFRGTKNYRKKTRQQ